MADDFGNQENRDSACTDRPMIEAHSGEPLKYYYKFGFLKMIIFKYYKYFLLQHLK